MLAMIPQLDIGTGSLMAAFLLMSGLAMLIVLVCSWLYVVSVNAAGTSRTLDAGLAVVSFLMSKLWMASLLPVVAFCNGVGGGAVGATAAMQMSGRKGAGAAALGVMLIAALIGVVSLSGSLTAWIRLNGLIKRPLGVRGQQILGLVLIGMVLAFGGYIVVTAAAGADRPIASSVSMYWLFGWALLTGILITLPLQTAHMPVAIYFFNAFIGLAIGLEGFVLGSLGLMIAGLLVGTARMMLSLPIARTPMTEVLGTYGDIS